MARDFRSGDLFDTPRPAPAVPGSQDYRPVVSHLLGEMFARSGKDRYQIAADASRLSGMDISKQMLDGYTSEARDTFNAPAWLLPVLEAVCTSHLYTQWLADIRGGRVLLGEEVLRHEYARLEAARDELDAALKALKPRIRRPA
jgi:hypothetical protein